MKKIVMQQDEKDCGVACVSMILNHYGTNTTLQKLRELSGTDLEGTTVFGLKKTFEKFDFISEAIKADNNIWGQNDLKFPLIAHTILDSKYLHYVVIYGVDKDKLLIADPAKGRSVKTIDEFSREWTGVLLLLSPAETYSPKKESVRGLFTFFPVIWKQKSLVLRIIFVSFFINIFGIASAYYFQGILDYFIPNQKLTTLNVVSIGLIIVYLINSLFSYIRNCSLMLLGQRMSVDIMLKYLKHIFTLPMSFFSTRKSGEIISRFLDANKIIDALANVTLSLFLDVTIILMVGITLFIQNKILFMITLVSLPLYLLTILSFVKSYELLNEKEMTANAKLNSSIIESIKGIETIKSYNMEEKNYKRIDEDFKNLMEKTFKSGNLDNIQSAIKQGIELISSGFILWIGSHFVIKGDISLGQLITYNALLIFFTEPLQNIINLQPKLQSAQVANNRLNEVFSIESEKDNLISNPYTSNDIFKKEITVNNLFFSYNINDTTLENITFCIPPNSKVALVGVSGSGKSTLAKLLVNFYLPTEGSIRYGKIDNLDIQLETLRNNVTYLSQESFFFSGTILENLSFGLETPPSFERVAEICDAVQLIDFINDQPLKFNTVLDEGGMNLSGGQRQRLAIARALIKDSNILILDEATSGLDSFLENEIMKYLLRMENKTILFISHHLSIAEECDQVLVLNNGVLVEDGTHESLRYNGGFYQKLWDV